MTESFTENATPGYGFTPAGQIGNNAGVTSYLYPHHSPVVAKQLIETAQALVYPRGVGIYATDETPEGIEARLSAAADVKSEVEPLTEEEKKERRKNWRACLYGSLPTEYISGVILHSETLIDFNLAPLLTARGIIPGIRADTDSHPLPISPLEPATQGLDDLLPRLLDAKARGARFSKWRAPILCNASTLPTQAGLEVQAESLARFAAISQQAGLVPIVEPDVDFAEDADLKRSVEVHVKIINMIFARCATYGVLTEGTLIKPSFPQPGLKHPSRSITEPKQVAEATASALVRSLPIGVAGVVFLSGGLPDETASLYLSTINTLLDSADAMSAYKRLPPLTFSFGRGLQGDAMRKWVAGDEDGAKEAFRTRASVCSAAVKGKV